MQTHKTKRYLAPLRHEHPHEAALITELMVLPMRRRADRVRELMARGAFRDVPPVPYTSGHARGDIHLTPVRLGIYLYPTAPGDAAVLADIELVHPKLVSEFLRDRLIAGLLGKLQPVDIEIDACATAAAASSAPSRKPVDAVIATAKANGIVGFPTTPPNPSRDTAPAAPPSTTTSAVKRPELLKLFQ